MGIKNTLNEIAGWINGEVVGDSGIVISGIAGIKEARKGDLTFIADDKYLPLLKTTEASAVIVSRSASVGGDGVAVLKADNPSLAFSKVAAHLYDDEQFQIKGVHPTAIIAADAVLGKDVAIGPYAVIKEGVQIGDGSSIESHCYIGPRTILGKNCRIYPGVSIRERIVIGNRVVIHCGTVVGSDGFGYVNVGSAQEKIPQIGIVQIDDDVEIGANVTIDRARFEKTVIGQGTKIDNLVQVAHNVIIGKHCIICAQVGIAGSCIIEDNVVLAGQVGLAGHLTVGKGAVIASGSGVPNDVPAGETYWGFPAKPIKHARRVNASVQRLPHYVQVINDLKKRVEELEAKQS